MTPSLQEAVTKQAEKGRTDRERVEYLPLEQLKELKVDVSYQRELSHDLVQEIADNWSDEAAGTIVVSERSNGKRYIVNGQHRVAAAQMSKQPGLIAQVVRGMTKEQEALLRLQTNRRLIERALDRFKALLAIGDPMSKDIMKITESFNSRVNFVPDAKYGLNCITALEKVYMNGGADLLRETFQIMQDAFGKIDGDAGTADIIRSIAWFIDQHEVDFARNRQDLVERLHNLGPAALKQKGKVIRATMGGTQWINTYRAIVETYNQDRPRAQRLHWSTRGWSRDKVD